MRRRAVAVLGALVLAAAPVLGQGPRTLLLRVQRNHVLTLPTPPLHVVEELLIFCDGFALMLLADPRQPGGDCLEFQAEVQDLAALGRALTENQIGLLSGRCSPPQNEANADSRYVVSWFGREARHTTLALTGGPLCDTANLAILDAYLAFRRRLLSGASARCGTFSVPW